jgi:hypothetical protein
MVAPHLRQNLFAVVILIARSFFHTNTARKFPLGYVSKDTNLKAWPSLRVRCSTNSHQLRHQLKEFALLDSKAFQKFVIIRVIRVSQ